MAVRPFSNFIARAVGGYGKAGNVFHLQCGPKGRTENALVSCLLMFFLLPFEQYWFAFGIVLCFYRLRDSRRFARSINAGELRPGLVLVVCIERVETS